MEQLLSMSKIFSEKIFRIPDYQRGYAWTLKEVKDFWGDLCRLEKDIITDPKTVKSNRMITMPEFLSEELETYIGMLYGLNENDRIFQISKSYLHHEMDRGVKLSGVKRIRIHDLRHSHVSLLINMGYSAVAIGERVGHASVEITYRYAHLFPTIQTEMAENLNQEREEYLDE